MNGFVERIELFEDYLDRVKRKIGSREPTIFFVTEVAKAQDLPRYRAFITFSTIIENALYVNANLLLDESCADDAAVAAFSETVKKAENVMIDRAKKELPSLKLIRGATNLI